MAGRERKGKRVVVWPVNIDTNASRGEGRKVARSVAVPSPRVEEIARAAEELGLNPEVEDRAYPRLWWRERRRVVVDKAGSKLETLRLLARKVAELRERRR